MHDWMLDSFIESALKEDMPFSDVTTDALICESVQAEAVFTAKGAGVIAGIPVAKRVFLKVDPALRIEETVSEGQWVQPGTVLLRIEGSAASLLKAERTALNLLQRLCGIATAARTYSEAVKDLPVRIVDTRKTTPLLRNLEKYAVRTGGAHNHRFSLSDAVMIKDNHIAAAGSIRTAVDRVRARIPHTMTIEVEVTDLVQLQEALDVKADIIMLDNMSLEMMAQAVAIGKGKAILEASGGVTLETVRDIALTGVDVISVGALTHSVKSLDISMGLKLK